MLMSSAPGRMVLPKMAESSGPAPQAWRPETASNRSPRFAVLLSEKLAEARGDAPQRQCRPVRFKRVPAPRPVSPPKVPPAGIAPASIRLEGGGLSFSATRRKFFGSSTRVNQTPCLHHEPMFCLARHGQETHSRRTVAYVHAKTTVFHRSGCTRCCAFGGSRT